MGQSHVNEFGIHAFDIGQHQQLFDSGVVAHVAFHIGIGIPPLFGCLTEEGDIEHVRFVGVDYGGLRWGHRGWDQVRFDGIGVEAVVEFGKGTIQIPGKRQATIFILLEALEFLDEVEFELDRDPGGKLKSDVLVCVGAAVTAGLGDQTAGNGGIYSLSWRQDKAVESRPVFKPLEFEGFKIDVM